jgi:hypothetical protein
MMKFKYTLKFIWGIVLIVASLLLGLLTKIFMILYLNNENVFWSMVIIYILSWPMLIWGIWWAGKEYAESLRKYFQYKYYHNHMKVKTKKAYHATKERTQKLKERAKVKSAKLKEKTKEKTRKLKNKLKNNRH